MIKLNILGKIRLVLAVIFVLFCFVSQVFAIDKDVSSNVTGDIYSQIKAVDMDGDGKKEMIFGASDGMIHVYDYEGKEKNVGAFPFQTSGPILTEIATDFDKKENRLQIYSTSMDGNLYRIDAEKGLKWRYRSGGSITFVPPELVHDKDGNVKVYVGTRSGKVTRVNEEGEADWSTNLPASINTPLEVGTEGSPGNEREYLVVRTAAGEVNYFEPNPASADPLWKAVVSNGDGYWPYPLKVKDLDQNGIKEVYTETGTPHQVCRIRSGGEVQKMRVVKDKSGCNFRFYDMDNDGFEEMIYTENSKDNYVQLVVTDRNGEVLDKFPRRLPNKTWSSSPPSISDIDGDGKLDIIYTYWKQLEDGKIKGYVDAVDLEGKRVTGYPKEVGKCVAPLTLSDLDGDGELELIVPGGISYTGKQLHIIKTKARIPIRLEVLNKVFTVN